MKLQPFGVRGPCVKCGYPVDNLDYQQPPMRFCDTLCDLPSYFNVASEGYQKRLADPPGHLHLTCPKCGYVWLTQTKDAKPEVGA